VFVEARVGVAVAVAEISAQDLLRQAEVALDQTREDGATGISFFSSARDVRVLRRMRLHSELHKALERQELCLHYQPQVDISTGQIFGFEALMRWQHPDLGAVSPAEFIPIAEESGLILAMGAWALDEACRQSRAWRDAGLRPVRMAVNLSTRQFDDDRILADVAQALARHRIAADQLELEITESVVLKGFERTVTLLTAFKTMGLVLSIDDFGTGYSSLSYLKRFPVDALKVDQSFVRNIDTDAGDAAITRAVVALAHSFGLCVIAEGVESAGQLAYLTQLGCEYAQGYWFSKPLPAQQAALLLAHGLKGLAG
jgi:EAL domain-containing protein (putative c-di-GMP-specific phosphodiesterase class I)